MTRAQENFLTMIYAVKAVVDKFLSTWTSNTVFAAAYAAFTSKIPLIEQNRDAQLPTSKGITEEKTIKRNALAEKALFIVNRMQSYGNVVGNKELLDSINFTQSSFDKSRDTTIVGIVNTIIAKANTHVAALAPYGVTAALITDLQTSSTAYSAYIAKPRTVTTQTKNATENLAVLFKEEKFILEKRLDLDIEVFKATKPDFYSQYKTARDILTTSGGAISVLGSVTLADTGEPIKGVTFTFVAENGQMKADSAATVKPVVKKSAAKGKFRTSLPENTYRVTVEKIGFKKQELIITVANGETTNLTVKLEKN